MIETADHANRTILDFHSGAGTDDRGRYLREIQRWPDERLEYVHDFIQWMFPLVEPSGVNPSAPVLDRPTIREFHASPELLQNLRASFLRMLRFYGLEWRPEPDVRVERASNFAASARNWLSPGNHNHLRITRIIKCLRLLGLEREARAFYDCLASIYEEQSGQRWPAITAGTFAFWRAAACDPVDVFAPPNS